MAYTNNNGQVRVGVRSGISNSPIVQPAFSASLIQALYGVWNGEVSTTLGTSLSNAWNGELVGTTQSNSLDSGVYLHLNGVTQSSTIDDSIYAVWKADGNATDSVGSNNGTIMGGLTYSTGKIGSAFQFNGTNAYVRLADNSMNFTGDFTISAWVYITSGGPQTILSNEYYSGTTMKGWGIYIDNAGSGQTGRFLQFAVYRNTMTDYTIYQASLNDLNATYSGLTNNAWSHISIVRKSGVDTIIYVNGEKVNTTLVGASASRTLDPLYNTTQYVTIGADSWNSTGTQFGNYMKNGSKIDGLSVWNRALDSSEITMIYNVGNGAQYPYSPNFTVSGDLIGSGRAAMINGASHSTGYTGTAISLDGVNDYLQFPDNIIDPIKSEFSISFWMKTTATTGWIFSEMTTVNNGHINSEWDRGISLVYYGSGSFEFKSGVNGSDFSVTYNAGSRYGVGYMSMTDWNHITLTYKQGSAAKIYFNGTLVATTTANALTRSTVNSLRIGRATSYYNGSTSRSGYLNASIDGFTIWNREVTQADVSMLYNGKNPNMKYPYSNKTIYGIYDSVGSVNGTYLNTSRQGILMVDGKLDKSFWFDGSSSISIPNNSLNSLLSGDFSVGFWVYATHGSGGTVSPFTYTSVSGTTINGFEMRFAGWSPKFVMYNNNTNANSVILSSSTNMVQNTWNHVVITRKRGTRSKFYLNGALVASNTSTADPVISGTFIGNIGHNKMTGFNTILFSGSMMDGITTWSKELMDDEVTQLYNAGNGIQAPFTGNLPSTSNQLGVDNGTLMNGCTFTDGEIGKAFTFDGINDFVLLPTNSMRFTGDFSYSFFVSLGSTSGQQTVFSCENYLSNENGDRGYIINFTNGLLKFLGYYNSTVIIDSSSTTTVTANTWNHFVVTKTSSQVKIYMNGVLQTTTNYTGIIAYNSVVYPSIGVTYKQNNVNNNNYHYISAGSKIDALTAYQKELTQSEITELYNSGNGKQITATPIVQSGLVLNLDASRSSSYTGTGTNWTDISGNSLNGTLTNGPVFGTSSGGQISFDGVNDYVSIANNSSFEFASTTKDLPFTFTGWVKYGSGGNFINKGDTGNASQESYAIVIDGTGIAITLYDTQGGRSVSIKTSAFSPTQNTWYHYTISYTGGSVDGTGYQTSYNGTTNIYINGVSYATTITYTTSSGTYNRMRVQNTPLYIGSFGTIGTWASFFNGSISSNMIYNRVLSSTEVLQNFNATKGRFGL